MTLIRTHINYAPLVERFATFLCVELDIRPRTITIASYEPDDNTLGICLDESEDEFIILVKDKGRNITDVFVTIAHEMIHVKQYMKENLGWFLDNRSDIPYLERWWEKEAFSFSSPLVEKFTKIL